jgi:hypothetical protein
MRTWLDEEFVVPQDRNAAFAGRPPGDKEGIAYVREAEDLELRRDCPSGFPLHARCWSLLERVAGADAEQHLGLLFRVLRDRYRELRYGDIETENAMDDAIRAAIKAVEEAGGADNDDLPDVPVIDPLHNAAVQSLVRESKSRAQERTMQKESASAPLCVLSRLPLDIQYMLLNILDYTDMFKIQQAVRWPVDNTYWYARAPRTIVFELRDISKDDPVDWEYLCLKAEKMVLCPWGALTSRQIALGPVLVATERFREALGRNRP